MYHGYTPRGASRYISHWERAPTAGFKLSLCHKVSRKRGCSRGQRRFDCEEGEAKRRKNTDRGPILRGPKPYMQEEECVDVQIYDNARPLCTGLSIRSLHVVIPIINITIVTIFVAKLRPLRNFIKGFKKKRKIIIYFE